MMKKLSLSVLALLCLLIFSSEAGGKQVVVTYDWTRIQSRGSNQMAIWVEDLSGRHIRTLFVTRFTAKGGYIKRPAALPGWVEKFDLKNASAKRVDAVTGATPQTGKQTVIWDCTGENGKVVPKGRYIIRMEANIQETKKMYCQAEIKIGRKKQLVPGEISFSSPELASGNVLFKEVMVEYFPSEKK